MTQKEIKKVNLEKRYILKCGNNIDLIKKLDDNSVDSIVTDPPYELGFMNKSWDSTGIAFNVELWKEALRVLKPGGHLIAFSGSRTYHRMAVAIEDAGFQIRDQIMWVYGSGFPKSLDVSKAIEGKLTIGSSNTKDFKKLNGEKLDKGNWGIAKLSKEQGYRDTNYDENGKRLGDLEPSTEQAKQWEGWGTALKPSTEPIVLARKPLSEKTVAENVLKFGVGALNIDGCRIEYEDTNNPATNPKYRKNNGYKLPEKGQESNGSVNFTSSKNEINDLGRWPANFIHDGLEEEWSRYFYCPKASKKDRNEGLDRFDLCKTNDGREKEIDNAFQRGSTLRANNHPTVKPTDLMAYLVRLVTPPNGVVLDPFNGSGSTGKACMREGFRYIGFDLSKEYINISRFRINNELNK